MSFHRMQARGNHRNAHLHTCTCSHIHESASTVCLDASKNSTTLLYIYVFDIFVCPPHRNICTRENRLTQHGRAAAITLPRRGQHSALQSAASSRAVLVDCPQARYDRERERVFCVIWLGLKMTRVYEAVTSGRHFLRGTLV